MGVILSAFEIFEKKIADLFQEFFCGRFDTSGSIIPLSVPEIEGGSPERDGEEEEKGLVLDYSCSWMTFH